MTFFYYWVQEFYMGNEKCDSSAAENEHAVQIVTPKICQYTINIKQSFCIVISFCIIPKTFFGRQCCPLLKNYYVLPSSHRVRVHSRLHFKTMKTLCHFCLKRQQYSSPTITITQYLQINKKKLIPKTIMNSAPKTTPNIIPTESRS